jgi:hypothetical protein
MISRIRLTALAFTAVAITGVLGAQQRTGSHSSPRAQASRAQAPRGPSSRPSAPRGYAESRGRPDVRGQQRFSPARADVRGGRPETQGRYDPRTRGAYQAPNEARGREGFRPPIAEHGRPLITRGYVPAAAYGREGYASARYVGDRRFVPRGGLPFGWEGRVVFHGLFPLAYAGYCEAVPYDYNYLLPPMMPSYDPCLFGDRVIVYDRFSRSIVFVAAL